MGKIVEFVASTPSSQWETSKQNGAPTDKAATLEITASTRQTWKGFGGCFNEMGWDVLQRLAPAERDTVMERLFQQGGECDFSFCRAPIGASDYALSWYSLNETENDYAMEHFSIERDMKLLIPYIKNAQEYRSDITLFASPWSPPTWMKFPRAHNYGTMIWNEQTLTAYALYFVKYVQAYSQQGIPVHQIHVQNEPISSQKFPSCIWTGEQFAEFIGKYLGPAFEKHNIDTEIWLGTLNGPETDNRKWSSTYNHYANVVMSDEAARRYTKGISYQWAGKYALQKTHLAWPDLPLIQSENECGDGVNNWDYAFYVYDLIHHYVLNGVSAYVYWNMVLPTGGESTWGWRQNSMISVDPSDKSVSLNPEYYMMKHFSHYIKPGDSVVELKGPWAANAVAFRNEKNTTVVIRNPFKKESEICLQSGSDTVSITVKPESVSTLVLEN